MSHAYLKQSASTNWINYQSELVPHNCEVDVERDDLREVCPGRGLGATLVRAFRSTLLASHKNRRAIRFFRSHANIAFERSRQVRLHGGMIHPFSIFRVYWEVFFILTMMVAIIVNSYHQAFPFGNRDVTLLQYIVITGDIIFITDVVLHFFTGRLREETRRVELGFGKVVKSYLKGPFILDVIASLPYRYIDRLMLEHVESHDEQRYFDLAIHSLSFLKDFLRVLRTFPYYHNTCKVLNLSHEKSVYTLIIVGLLYYFHYSACLIYYLSEFADDFDFKSSTWYRDTVLVRSTEPIEMYSMSLVRTVTNTLGLCYRFLPLVIEDQISCSILAWIGQILFLVIVGKNLQITRARHASYTRYAAMMTQVEQFMASRKLPKRLKRQVVEFYEYRFQNSFFNEREIMSAISTQLKQDFMYDRCKDLVEKVAFFNELPTAVLVRIVNVMRIEFFLAKEEVIRLHSTGSQMYFIKTGTVVVHSSSGKEVCHLEDGNHFGEIALVLQNFRRVASVATLENCELFVLTREDFNRVMAPFPEYLDKIRATALKRLERTMHMEDGGTRTLEEYIKSMTTSSSSPLAARRAKKE